MPRDPQDIYARQLLSSRGYPLWTPEPSRQLLVYREDGLRIGDVGVVIPEDGCFDVFFNICLPKSHRFHQATGVPDNFEPIQLDDMDVRTVARAENPGRVLGSSSVKTVRIEQAQGNNASRPIGLDYQFNLSSNEGALLILPEGAERHDLRDHHRFMETATQHAADWYRFAEERVGQIIGPDSLYLITGFHKARSWSLAAFEKTTGSTQYPAQFKFSQAMADNVTATYSWDTMRTLDWRVGPLEDYRMPNQAVLIRGFKIALRTGMFGTRWISVKAGMPSTQLPSPAQYLGTVPRDSFLGYLFSGMSTGGVSGTGTQDEIVSDSALKAARNEIENNGALAVGENVVIHRIPEASQVFHPSDIINRYLLNKDPSANVAITHDNDWIAILEENLLQPEEFTQEGCLETVVSHKYDTISEGGVVYLRSSSVVGKDEPSLLADPSGPEEGEWRPEATLDFTLETHHEKGTHGRCATFAQFMSDDRIVSGSDQDMTIRWWSSSDGLWDNEVLEKAIVCAVATSPDRHWVAYGGKDGQVTLINLQTRAITRSQVQYSRGHDKIETSCDEDRVGGESCTGSAHAPGASMIQSLSFSPDSDQLASGAWDGTILLWSLTPLQPAEEPFNLHKDTVWCIRYSPDGKKIASCDRHVVEVGDTATGDKVTITARVWSLAWSTSHLLLAGCIDGSVRCYNSDSGELLALCKAHTDVVFSIVLSHNTNFIVTASWDKTVRFLDARAFRPIGPHLQHDAHVHAIAMSPNDDYLVSGTRGPIFHLWDLKTIVPSLFARPPLQSAREGPTGGHGHPVSVGPNLNARPPSLLSSDVSSSEPEESDHPASNSPHSDVQDSHSFHHLERPFPPNVNARDKA